MQETFKYIKDSLCDFFPPNEVSSLSRMIIENITGLSFSSIINDKNTKITLEQKKRIDEVISRLKLHEPIQYILGEAEFFGLKFIVDENVLIPRPETEELVEIIINDNKDRSNLNVLDIGTGSGCIPISLKKNMPTFNFKGWDVSGEALETAKKNAKLNNVSVEFEEVNVLRDIPKGQYDIIVSNPPYILEKEKIEMDDNVLKYEPHLALFVPDNKALLFYERIADIGKSLLKEKGKLYFEINSAKGKETTNMLKEKGYKNVLLIKDISGNDRIVRADLI